MKRWKCTVCGQIFEGETPPVPCPVCGAGEDAFVLVAQEEGSAYRQDTQRRFLIVGLGAAALSCAKAIRQRDHTCRITLVGEEEAYPYNRPALSDVVADGLSFAAIALEAAEYYQQAGMTLLYGRRITAIDPEAKQAVLDDGQTLAYDSLCLATGASPFNPVKAVPGGVTVQTLRTYADARQLMALPEGCPVLVVGGGILGIEAAVALNDRGHRVTLVELAERILSLQADERGSRAVQEGLEKAGITVYPGKTVAQVDAAGAVLTDGSHVDTAHILVSIGVRSNLSLAKALALQTGRGIQVNERMETSLPDIYACGDCAEFQGRVPGLWNVAMAQGEVAGAVMAGEERAYQPPIAALAFDECGVQLFSAGQVNLAEGSRLVMDDPLAKKYRLLLFQQGKLCGTLFLGETKGAAQAMTLLEKGASMKEAAALLTW